MVTHVVTKTGDQTKTLLTGYYCSKVKYTKLQYEKCISTSFIAKPEIKSSLKTKDLKWIAKWQRVTVTISYLSL